MHIFVGVKRYQKSIYPLVVTTICIALGCSPEQGAHFDTEVPENHARVHQPSAPIDGELEPGELSATRPRQPSAGEPESLVTGNLVIADNVVDACLLPKDEALFAYDSAKLSEKAERTLALLARCFDTGPMRYQDLLVTGHTDPRGSDEYNLDLGLERAVAVRDYLVDEGVEDFRIEARSVGERRASNDPEDWDDDRKVEIQLAS